MQLMDNVDQTGCVCRWLLLAFVVLYFMYLHHKVPKL